MRARGSDAPPKPEDPLAAKPRLSSDTSCLPAAPGQADELWRFSLIPQLKPELIPINYMQHTRIKGTEIQ